ncbi:Leucine-Rich Repeat Neuronal Protein 3 [Manis pentadactyla]|nr:Leucine-Rich Repeat Neuronal Protein 3 [Manis pentadactyla]
MRLSSKDLLPASEPLTTKDISPHQTPATVPCTWGTPTVSLCTACADPQCETVWMQPLLPAPCGLTAPSSLHTCHLLWIIMFLHAHRIEMKIRGPVGTCMTPYHPVSHWQRVGHRLRAHQGAWA